MMENLHSENKIPDIKFSDEINKQFGSAAVWAKVTAVITFTSAGLSLITSFSGGGANLFGSLIGTAITIAVAYYLYRFAGSMLNAISSLNQQELQQSVNDLQSYFKITGVLIIVAFILVAIVLFLLMIL